MMSYLIANTVIGIVCIVFFWMIRSVIHRIIDRKRHKQLKPLIIPLRDHQKIPHVICLFRQDKPFYGVSLPFRSMEKHEREIRQVF